MSLSRKTREKRHGGRMRGEGGNGERRRKKLRSQRGRERGVVEGVERERKKKKTSPS